MRRSISVVLALVAALTVIAPASGAEFAAASVEPVPAFPGAEGFGAYAIGGRGGDVYVVTSLADAGPGSLRDAIDSSDGPRTVVFAVAGTIDLESPLDITASYLTLAGQTSPGGVTLAGYPVNVNGVEHVIIRYIRFRPGDRNAAAVPGKPARGNGDLSGSAADALSIINSSDVIVDHVSASWSMDETLSVTKSARVTVQHSLISESLNDSYHPEGEHGFGSLVRGTGDQGYSFIGNMWAHHQRRMPAIGGQQDDPPPGVPGDGLDIDLVNNVMYDWMLFPNHVLNNPHQLRVNLQNNIYVAGPSLAFCACPWINFEGTAEQLQIAASGNVVNNSAAGLRPMNVADFVGPVTLIDTPFAFERLAPTVVPVPEAALDVLFWVGASRYRDSVDLRVVLQGIFGVGGVIDSQDEVGGWPTIPTFAAPLDHDGDGMADVWEIERGLDPADPTDHASRDIEATRTNLEWYLDSLIPPGSTR